MKGIQPVAVPNKAGIGYFEHVGEVTGNGEVTISFTSGQLDDALKSLTAVDLGAGQVTGIRYNSVAPISERLRDVGGVVLSEQQPHRSRVCCRS